MDLHLNVHVLKNTLQARFLKTTNWYVFSSCIIFSIIGLEPSYKNNQQWSELLASSISSLIITTVEKMIKLKLKYFKMCRQLLFFGILKNTLSFAYVRTRNFFYQFAIWLLEWQTNPRYVTNYLLLLSDPTHIK